VWPTRKSEIDDYDWAKRDASYLYVFDGPNTIKWIEQKNFRRKLEVEFGDLLQFEDLLDNGKLFIIPNNLSKLSLAREVAQLS